MVTCSGVMRDFHYHFFVVFREDMEVEGGAVDAGEVDELAFAIAIGDADG